MKQALNWKVTLSGSFFLVSVLSAAILLFQQRPYGQLPSGGVLSKNQAQYDVNYYQLDLEVIFEYKTLIGSTVIKLTPLANELKRVELDLISQFRVSQVEDRQANSLNFQHKNNKLWIDLAEPFQKGKTVELIIRYSGQPLEATLPPWRGGFSWSKDARGNHWIGVSCQGEGAKVWFPCKDHLSDKPDSAAVNITIPEPYFCASNGLLRKITRPRDGWRTFHWSTHYPISNYNINISIGIYDAVERTYIASDSTIMPVFFYILPQDCKRADELIDMAVDMLYTYRNFYGEYPFIKEKFALVQTSYLGMEHQTVNAYGNRFRYKTINGYPLDLLMLHEMGHEWWGNKVTIKDWADFWIHEGICTYGEALYYLTKGGETAYHEHIRSIKHRIRNKLPLISKRNITSQEGYNPDIYTKGAYIMHSLRYMLGDSLFFKTLKEFVSDSLYTYQNLVTTDDFIELVNRNAGHDYRPFFRLYLHTTDLPEIHIDPLAENTYRIYIPNIDFPLPMDVRLDGVSKRMLLSKTPVEVVSVSVPVVDEQEWFLKKTVESPSGFMNWLIKTLWAK